MSLRDIRPQVMLFSFVGQLTCAFRKALCGRVRVSRSEQPKTRCEGRGTRSIFLSVLKHAKAIYAVCGHTTTPDTMNLHSIPLWHECLKQATLKMMLERFAAPQHVEKSGHFGLNFEGAPFKHSCQNGIDCKSILSRMVVVEQMFLCLGHMLAHWAL